MSPEPNDEPLLGYHVVNTGVNVPATAASYRLAQLGATVTKVEPPAGDPLETASDGLYHLLTDGQRIVRADLRSDDGKAALHSLLATADLLLTSSRPAALERLDLGWPSLADRYPTLAQVAIVGRPAPDQHLPGHDLTYAASAGLLAPARMPTTLVADLGGAERAATVAVALLLLRARNPLDGASGRYREVALEDAAVFFALPRRFGLTTPAGILGGEFPFYSLYEADGGWIALAALEGHFAARLLEELAVDEGGAGDVRAALKRVFRTKTPAGWEAWANERDLPLVAVQATGGD